MEEIWSEGEVDKLPRRFLYSDNYYNTSCQNIKNVATACSGTKNNLLARLWTILWWSLIVLFL
jgi:hypothetical protein